MKQRAIATMPRFLMVLAVVVVLGAALSAGSALAAKGGNGKGGRGGGGPSATLTVSPDPAVAGSDFTISGSGFNANKTVIVGVSGFLPFETLTADGSGSFVTSYTRDLQPGTYTLLGYQEKGKRWVVKASLTFEVGP